MINYRFVKSLIQDIFSHIEYYSFLHQDTFVINQELDAPLGIGFPLAVLKPLSWVSNLPFENENINHTWKCEIEFLRQKDKDDSSVEVSEILESLDRDVHVFLHILRNVNIVYVSNLAVQTKFDSGNNAYITCSHVVTFNLDLTDLEMCLINEDTENYFAGIRYNSYE